jgi:hypothetical protein
MIAATDIAAITYSAKLKAPIISAHNSAGPTVISNGYCHDLLQQNTPNISKLNIFLDCTPTISWLLLIGMVQRFSSHPEVALYILLSPFIPFGNEPIMQHSTDTNPSNKLIVICFFVQLNSDFF